MPAYFVALVDIHDQAGYERYQQAAGGAGAPAGMKVLAMDDNTTTLEGKWPAPKTVILEFPDEEALRAWYFSSGYQAAAKIRQAATTSTVALVKGLG